MRVWKSALRFDSMAMMFWVPHQVGVTNRAPAPMPSQTDTPLPSPSCCIHVWSHTDQLLSAKFDRLSPPWCKSPSICQIEPLLLRDLLVFRVARLHIRKINQRLQSMHHGKVDRQWLAVQPINSEVKRPPGRRQNWGIWSWWWPELLRMVSMSPIIPTYMSLVVINKKLDSWHPSSTRVKFLKDLCTTKTKKSQPRKNKSK